jgi:hypothetical protein
MSIPADLVRLLALVDPFPVLAGLHGSDLRIIIIYAA